MSNILPAGKLPPELLASLLARIPADPSVVIGAGLGRDAAAVRHGVGVLVLKTDPITFATDEIGWYAPNVNANDIACMGATPRWMLVTALLPEGSTTPELVEHVFGTLRDACAALEISLVGGHTEITTGLDRVILTGMMVGEAREEDLIDPRRASPGDALLLARGIAIEGTSLIAREMHDRLSATLDPDLIERARNFLHEPGISVVRAATALRRRLGADLHALHDPTEGGLATGIREIAIAAGTGVMVDYEQITIYPETRAICELLELDPLGLIASGALLAAVEASRAGDALATLEREGIAASQIGRLVEDTSVVRMSANGGDADLPIFAVDEIARLFATI